MKVRENYFPSLYTEFQFKKRRVGLRWEGESGKSRSVEAKEATADGCIWWPNEHLFYPIEICHLRLGSWEHWKRWECCQIRSAERNSSLEITSIHGGPPTSTLIMVCNPLLFSFSCLLLGNQMEVFLISNWTDVRFMLSTILSSCYYAILEYFTWITNLISGWLNNPM